MVSGVSIRPWLPAIALLISVGCIVYELRWSQQNIECLGAAFRDSLMHLDLRMFAPIYLQQEGFECQIISHVLGKSCSWVGRRPVVVCCYRSVVSECVVPG